eukprot:2270322-Rhodomonas_salina.1
MSAAFQVERNPHHPGRQDTVTGCRHRDRASAVCPRNAAEGVCFRSGNLTALHVVSEPAQTCDHDASHGES